MEADGNDFEIIEVVGNWAPGDSQKVTADAIAVHGEFDAVFTQGGTNGSVQAMIDAGHPFVPMAGEAENGFRKQIAEYSDEGLIGLSYGQSPGLVAIAMKAALTALQGETLPQLISVPIPVVDYTTLEDGVNFWSDLPDDFFTPNEFPPCGVNITAPEIMAESDDGRVRPEDVSPPRLSKGVRRRPYPLRIPGHARSNERRGVSDRRFSDDARHQQVAMAASTRCPTSTFACRLGSIHAVLGENGAGKSTLIKIISGVVQPDRGEMHARWQARVNSRRRFRLKADGVVCIFQELSLMPDLSVADNICITDPPKQSPRPDRQPCSSPTHRGTAGPRRLRRHQSVGAGIATCRCRADRWWRSPRHSVASRNS